MVTTAAPATSDLPEEESTWVPTHYQRVVLSVCERRHVTTAKAVFSSTEIKLVEAGVQIRPEIYRRLARHELRMPLEDLLTMDNVVGIASLVEFALELCRREPLLQLLVQNGENALPAATLVAPLQAMPMPPSLAFALSVLRDAYPGQFAHAMHVALVAAYLGLRMNLSKGECTSLTAAGLLHDTGTLHIDPAWMDGTRQLTTPEREELVRHPIIAAQWVNASGVYPRSVAVAILEHHERMDGSGYPRGIREEQISPMGQALLLAEVVAAFFEKYANDGAAVRLSLTLRLGHQKFPTSLTGLLLPILQATNIQTGSADDLQQVQRTSAWIARALAHWDELRSGMAQPGTPGGAEQPWTYVTQRVLALQRNLFDAGCHPDQQAELLPLLQNDPQGLKEMLFLVREAQWQLQSIAHTASTRWPHISGNSQDTGDTAVRKWRDALLGPTAH